MLPPQWGIQRLIWAHRECEARAWENQLRVCKPPMMIKNLTEKSYDNKQQGNGKKPKASAMGPIKNTANTAKGKQKHNDKCHCNNADINTFPNNIVYMFIV